jgi:hypothetical protein
MSRFMMAAGPNGAWMPIHPKHKVRLEGSIWF